MPRVGMVRLALVAVALQVGGAGGESCVGTANQSIDHVPDARRWIQLAGTLSCGSACFGHGTVVDEETLDFFAAYLMWTDHVNGLGGVRVGRSANQRYLVNITLCDDEGAPENVDRLYSHFACMPGPRAADFLLAPYGSALTRRAHDAVHGAQVGGQPCYKPLLLASGATADDVLGLPGIFSPLVPASKLTEPVLQTLRDAAERRHPARTVSTYAVLSAQGPFETFVARSLRKVLPVSCYDNSVDGQEEHPHIKGCEVGLEHEGYCHPTKNSLVNATGRWTPRPPQHIGDDRAGEGGCGFWDMGYCGGPECNGTRPLSPYAVGESESRGHGRVQGIIFNNTYTPEKQITGNIYEDLSDIFSACDTPVASGDGSCQLDALITAGDSRHFEQYVRVLGTFIAAADHASHLPKFAVFIGGLRLTAHMEAHRQSYPYRGWLGTTSWHEAMGRNSSATTEFLGNSSHFQSLLSATFRNDDRFNENSKVTSYHAQAAATLVMLQLALVELPLLPPTPANSGEDRAQVMFVGKNCSAMKAAFAKVDNSTFYGQIKLHPTLGWNQRPEVPAAVVQFLDYDQQPVLVGPPSMNDFGAAAEKLRYDAFCRGVCVGLPQHKPNPFPCRSAPSSAAEIIEPKYWNRSPRCYSAAQISFAASLLLIVVACIAKCANCYGRKEAELQRYSSAGLRESLLGTGGADGYLPNASLLAAAWSPRGERSSARDVEIELTISAKANPLSAGNSTASSGNESVSSVTSEDELRPSRMFRDRDSRGLMRMKQIGKGSFGIVSEATWKRGGEDGKDLRVAVKELELKATEETPLAAEMLRDLLKEFRKEVEICVALDHPNLVKFYGYTQQDPQEKSKGKGRILRLRIIQELMRGGALDRLLYTEKWAPRLAQTLKMSGDVADAMVYLHAIGDTASAREPIIHRDLKSPNLLLVEFPPKNDEPVVKITDFGLARQKDVRDVEETENFRASLVNGAEAQELARRTQVMTGCGTLYWMAPEVLKGDVYNEAVDVYAFAMCMWEMVACEVPWHSVAAAEVPFKVAIENKRPVRCDLGRSLNGHLTWPTHAEHLSCTATY